MNKNIEKYLSGVCSFIKYKGVHNEIREELQSHIEEIAQFNISKGMDEDDAYNDAVSRMGSCEEVGRKMNALHKPRMNWFVFTIVMMLILTGLIMAYISSRFEYQSVSMAHCLFYYAIGAAIFISAYFFDYRKLCKCYLWLYALAAALIAFSFISPVYVNGIRYINIAGLLTMPLSSVLSLLFVIAFPGVIYANLSAKTRGFITTLIIGIVSSAVLLPISRGSCAIVSIIQLTMILTAIKKHQFVEKKRQCAFILLGICAAAFIIQAVPHYESIYNTAELILSRGQSDPLNSGYLMTQTESILSAARPFGQVINVSGLSIDQILPELNSDYVLINLIAHFGVVPCIAVIAAAVLLIAKLIAMLPKIKNSYGFYLSLSACLFLTCQFISGILTSFNLIPKISIAFPFISWGGTGLIMNMLLTGIILSVWRRNDLIFENYSEIL